MKAAELIFCIIFCLTCTFRNPGRNDEKMREKGGQSFGSLVNKLGENDK